MPARRKKKIRVCWRKGGGRTWQWNDEMGFHQETLAQQDEEEEDGCANAQPATTLCVCMVKCSSA